VRKCGFANAWHVFNKQMTTGQQARHTVLNLRRLAHNDRVKLIYKSFKFFFDLHFDTLTEFFYDMNATGYFTHKDCWKHEMGQGHPECPERLDAIEDWLLATGVKDALDCREAPIAPIGDIELAHDRMMIAGIRGLGAQLAEDMKAGGPSHAQIDPDTTMNVHTWDAAMRAAGAALAATDAVMAGEMENAFCAVRPPGHHACHDKAMGFCFFNNMAIAARYALERHGLKRVAVVDFDVHHGNGTEDILQGDNRVLMVGIFQHPFYPHSGTDHPASNMLNLPVPAYTRGMDVRDLIETHWIPRLEAFKPEMIFISAGFDAHRDDDLGQMGLVEQDYAWITSRIKDVAKRHAKGRMVSSLEGGYNLNALARSVEAHIRVLADL
jgi:acetoin utilization deacetylase AcuC-like enzyme